MTSSPLIPFLLDLNTTDVSDSNIYLSRKGSSGWPLDWGYWTVMASLSSEWKALWKKTPSHQFANERNRVCWPAKVQVSLPEVKVKLLYKTLILCYVGRIGPNIPGIVTKYYEMDSPWNTEFSAEITCNKNHNMILSPHCFNRWMREKEKERDNANEWKKWVIFIRRNYATPKNC